MVEARRGSGGNAGEAKFSVYRESDAYVIPALLPSIATDMLLRGRPTLAGIVSLSNWIPFEELLAELSKRGVSVAECKNGEWQSVSL